MDYSSAVGRIQVDDQQFSAEPLKREIKVPGWLYLAYAVILIPAIIFTVRLFQGRGGVVGALALAFVLGTIALFVNKRYDIIWWLTLLQLPIGVTLFYSLNVWTNLPDAIFYIAGVFLGLLYGYLNSYILEELERPHSIIPAVAVHSSLLAIGGIILLIMQKLTLLLQERFAQLTVDADGVLLFGTFGLNVTLAFTAVFIAFCVPAVRKHHNKNEILALFIPIIIYIIGIFVANEFAASVLA